MRSNFEESYFKTQHIFVLFKDVVDGLGIDLDLWEYGEGVYFHDDDYNYISIYYSNNKLENHSLGVDFIKSTSGDEWNIERLEITQD